VPKIVALITVQANMGVLAYVGYNPWHMQYDNFSAAVLNHWFEVTHKTEQNIFWLTMLPDELQQPKSEWRYTC